MGFAYLGIGIGGTLVPLIATALTTEFGWRTALHVLGVLMMAIAFPVAWFVKDSPELGRTRLRADAGTWGLSPGISGGLSPTDGGQSPFGTAPVPLARFSHSLAFYLLLVGSMCSIGAVGGTVQNLKLFLSLDLKLSQTKSRASRRWSSSRAWRAASDGRTRGPLDAASTS